MKSHALPAEKLGTLETKALDNGLWLKNRRGTVAMVGVLTVMILVLGGALLQSVSVVNALKQEVSAGLAARTPRAVSTAAWLTPGSGLIVLPTPTSAKTPEAMPASGVHPVSSGKFPGQADPPAIVQWWDGRNAEGIFALREGETSFTYAGQGTWWRFASDSELDARYPTHRAEYFNSHPKGNEGKPKP